MKMNQIFRFAACRRSYLTGNQFTRRSSKPISSSPLISNNPTFSKFQYHSYNYPSPQIFSIRKFSGEPAAEGLKFDLSREISIVNDAVLDAQGDIELGYLPPLDAAKIPALKYKALMGKLVFFKVKAGDSTERLQILKEAVDQVVAFGKFAATGKNRELPYMWGVFKRWYSAGGKFEEEISESEDENDTTAENQMVDDASSALVAVNKLDIEAAKFNSDENYLANEFDEINDALLAAHDHIELGTLPPLEAVKIAVDKFKAIMEIVGLDYEDNADTCPDHQLMMRTRIRYLQDTIHETVAFAKYVAAGKNSGPPCWDTFIDCDAVGEFKFWEESFESKNGSTTLPTAQDQTAMHVDAASSSAVVVENLADNTYQELYFEEPLPA